jgi:hypothetical protein
MWLANVKIRRFKLFISLKEIILRIKLIFKDLKKNNMWIFGVQEFIGGWVGAVQRFLGRAGRENIGTEGLRPKPLCVI